MKSCWFAPITVLAKTLAFCGALAVMPTVLLAEQSDQKSNQPPAHVTLGWGGIISNDYFGDGEDRWRSSSYTISRLRGPKDTKDLPASFGILREFRMRAENITPADLAAPTLGDRRYAGVLALGLHSHFRPRDEEISLGVDLVIIGPQTGLSRLQSRLHDRLGLPSGAPAYGAQFTDTAKLSATAEIGRPISMTGAARNGSASLRPFVQGQVGVETLLRAGADLTLGQLSSGAVLMRDAVTGQRYRAGKDAGSLGPSVVIGGDVARVWDSYFLHKGGAAVMLQTRHRLRAGAIWHGKKADVFLGMTHLSPEFAQQPSGQTLGSFSVTVRF